MPRPSVLIVDDHAAFRGAARDVLVRSRFRRGRRSRRWRGRAPRRRAICTGSRGPRCANGRGSMASRCRGDSSRPRDRRLWSSCPPPRPPTTGVGSTKAVRSDSSPNRTSRGIRCTRSSEVSVEGSVMNTRGTRVVAAMVTIAALVAAGSSAPGAASTAPAGPTAAPAVIGRCHAGTTPRGLSARLLDDCHHRRPTCRPEGSPAKGTLARTPERSR